MVDAYFTELPQCQSIPVSLPPLPPTPAPEAAAIAMTGNTEVANSGYGQKGSADKLCGLDPSKLILEYVNRDDISIISCQIF